MTAPVRDRYGRYLIVPPKGGKPVGYTRATTIASTCDNSFGLARWQQRMVALGLAGRPDYLAQVAACHDDDKTELDRLAELAKEAAAASSGANTGSALHALTARIDQGEVLPTVPPPSDIDLEVYVKALAAAQIRVLPEFIEQVVVLDSIGVAGTFDRVLDIGGQPFIADLKTGQNLSYSWGAIAIQLALYANADAIYRYATDTRTAMPKVDRGRGLVIHLPAGRGICNFHWVDLAAGWKGVTLALAVREWRARKNLNTPTDATGLDPVASRRAWLIERVRHLRTHHPVAYRNLVTLWPVGVPTFRSATAQTAEHLAAIAAALMLVEAEAGVEFPPDTDPGFKIAKKASTVRRTTRQGRTDNAR